MSVTCVIISQVWDLANVPARLHVIVIWSDALVAQVNVKHVSPITLHMMTI